MLCQMNTYVSFHQKESSGHEPKPSSSPCFAVKCFESRWASWCNDATCSPRKYRGEDRGGPIRIEIEELPRASHIIHAAHIWPRMVVYVLSCCDRHGLTLTEGTWKSFICKDAFKFRIKMVEVQHRWVAFKCQTPEPTNEMCYTWEVG